MVVAVLARYYATTMANSDVDNELSLSGALQRVVDSSQNVMMAHINTLRIDVKEDLSRALSSIFFIGAGVILVNGAWLSLMAFTLHGLSDHLSLFASLAIVGSFTGLIGAGVMLAGLRQLRQRRKA